MRCPTGASHSMQECNLDNQMHITLTAVPYVYVYRGTLTASGRQWGCSLTWSSFVYIPPVRVWCGVVCACVGVQEGFPLVLPAYCIYVCLSACAQGCVYVCTVQAHPHAACSLCVGI